MVCFLAFVPQELNQGVVADLCYLAAVEVEGLPVEREEGTFLEEIEVFEYTSQIAHDGGHALGELYLCELKQIGDLKLFVL